MHKKRVEISLTKQQFFELLKLVYLGDWMANAIHNGSREDPQDEALKAVADFLYSHADAAGFSEYVLYDEELKRHFPTNALEELAHEYIEEYDEEGFWEELFYRLSNRDFARVYSDEEMRNMNIEERIEKADPFRQKWDTELNDHGIERLEIQEEK